MSVDFVTNYALLFTFLVRIVRVKFDGVSESRGHRLCQVSSKHFLRGEFAVSIDVNFRVGLPELTNNGSVSEVMSLLKHVESSIRAFPKTPVFGRAVFKKRHGSARTTTEQRREIQQSNLSYRELAAKHGINPKTAKKWKSRSNTEDRPMGPKNRGARNISREQEDEIVRFYRNSGQSIDECLEKFKKKMPQLTRSAYYRCIQRAGKSVLDEQNSRSLAGAIENLVERNDSSMGNVAIYVTGIHRG